MADLTTVLDRLVHGEDLEAGTAESLMRDIMAGTAPPAQVAGVLVALRAKGETAEELTGLVRAMRALAVAVPLEGPLVDTCGTGGDRAGTYNVSTVAAIVAAAAGARVAKHGNRAASGRCGSADVLEAWGVAIDLGPASVARCVDELGIGFCFAPRYHPAMRNVVAIRRELRVPTTFNVLGPLTNPAGARHQSIGVSDRTMAPLMAAVLGQLGSVHALVVHGADGLDELSPTGPAWVWEVRDGAVDEGMLDPADLGIPRARVEDLAGGDVEDNVAVADRVLAGTGGPRRDAALLGAAAALYAGDAVATWEDGLETAARAIDGGRARDLLEAWVERSRELAADEASAAA